MTDRKTLDRAKEWAPGTDEKINEWARVNLGFTLEHWQLDLLRQFEAPADEVIDDLPDEIIDADKVRDALTECRGMKDPKQVMSHIENTLLPEPAPRTMAEIDWGGDEYIGLVAHNRDTGKNVRMLARLNVNDGTAGTASSNTFKAGRHVIAVNNAGRIEVIPATDLITVPGTQIDLTPNSHTEDDGPTFDRAHTYRDKDGDEWSYVVRGWRGEGHILSRPYKTPPAEYGPYTRIEKEDERK